MHGQIFEDRTDAGQRLADVLVPFAGSPDVLVLAIPRGGVPVGYEVAKRLGAPLDVLVVRKLGVPHHEELAMGALASGGALVVERETIEGLGVAPDQLLRVIERERAELRRRERLFRGDDLPALELEGKTVIVVDDGLATGATMLAAVKALRARRPAAIVIAVPVAPPDTCARLRERVDEVVCLVEPAGFRAVGLWYEDFAQTSDEDVRGLLEHARRERERAAHHAPEAGLQAR